MGGCVMTKLVDIDLADLEGRVLAYEQTADRTITGRRRNEPVIQYIKPRRVKLDGPDKTTRPQLEDL